MRYNRILLFIFYFIGCSTFNRDQKAIVCKIQNTDILKKLITERQILGHIVVNDFDDNVKIDSFVDVSVKFPFEQNYPIDSIYYFYHNESNYKILAQSQFEKGLLYLEVDKNGRHNRYYTFGGYVLSVNNVQIDEKKNSLQLTFETDIWASTMPDTVKQFIKIESNKNSINFKIWNKFDTKDVWQLVIPD